MVLKGNVGKTTGIRTVRSTAGKALTQFAPPSDSGRPYNLICLDILMPEMDGQEALIAVRSVGAGKGYRPIARSPDYHDYVP